MQIPAFWSTFSHKINSRESAKYRTLQLQAVLHALSTRSTKNGTTGVPINMTYSHVQRVVGYLIRSHVQRVLIGSHVQRVVGYFVSVIRRVGDVLVVHPLHLEVKVHVLGTLAQTLLVVF